MKNLIEHINESFDYRAKIGNVLEVEMKHDGNFYWHTPQNKDWDKFKDMKDWEIDINEMPERFYIKIGK